MKRAPLARALPIATLALLSVYAPAAAQSLFSTRGLGVPVAPVAARARALGGIGVGLLGVNPSLVNPAEAGNLGLRGITAALQPSVRSMEFDGRTADANASRFPLIRVVYPFGSRVVATVGYGAFLDQSWAVISDGMEPIAGVPVQTSDVVESSGGIAQFRLGAAYHVTPSFALGLAGGLYTGSLARAVSRDFPESAGIDDFRTRLSWSYRGPLAAAGLRWDPLSFLRLGASVTWSGELEAEGEEGLARDRTFDLPLQAAAGASAMLSPSVMATVAGRWAGWSVAADQFDEPEAARDVWEVGGGLEWGGTSAGARTYPLRLGFHYGQLPFTLGGATPTEWSASLGLGVNFNMTEFGPLGTADATIERGGRGHVETTGLTEEFWRFTLSLSLFGG